MKRESQGLKETLGRSKSLRVKPMKTFSLRVSSLFSPDLYIYILYIVYKCCHARATAHFARQSLLFQLNTKVTLIYTYLKVLLVHLALLALLVLLVLPVFLKKELKLSVNTPVNQRSSQVRISLHILMVTGSPTYHFTQHTLT